MMEVLRAGFGIAYGLFAADPNLPFTTDDPLPSVYGSQYDCSIATKTHDPDRLWQGRFSGRIILGDGPRVRQVSRVACFPTKTECNTWLSYWDSKVHGHIIQFSCKRGVR